MITRAQLRHKGRRTERAAGAVARVLAGYGVADEIREHLIVTEWNRIVGERVAAHAWPDGFERGLLWVRAATAPWLHELSFQRDAIARRVNQVVGGPRLVDEVRVHLGRRRAAADDTLAGLARRVRPRARLSQRTWTPPSPGAARQISEETSHVEDADLRTALRELRMKIGM